MVFGMRTIEPHRIHKKYRTKTFAKAQWKRLLSLSIGQNKCDKIEMWHKSRRSQRIVYFDTLIIVAIFQPNPPQIIAIFMSSPDSVFIPIVLWFILWDLVMSMNSNFTQTKMLGFNEFQQMRRIATDEISFRRGWLERKKESILADYTSISFIRCE